MESRTLLPTLQKRFCSLIKPQQKACNVFIMAHCHLARETRDDGKLHLNSSVGKVRGMAHGGGTPGSTSQPAHGSTNGTRSREWRALEENRKFPWPQQGIKTPDVSSKQVPNIRGTSGRLVSLWSPGGNGLHIEEWQIRFGWRSMRDLSLPPQGPAAIGCTLSPWKTWAVYPWALYFQLIRSLKELIRS